MSHHEPDLGRRRAVTSLGGIGLMGITGCCALRPFPSPGLAGVAPPAKVRRLLAPTTIRKGLLKPAYAIDVHAHFFNASDVNVAGFIEDSVAHTMAEPLKGLMMAMAPIIDDLAGFATSASDEYRALLAMDQMLSTGGTVSNTLESKLSMRRDAIADKLFAKMKKRGVDREYMRLRVLYLNSLRVPSGGSDQFSVDMIRGALEPKNVLASKDLKLRALALSGTSLNPDGVIQFAGYMLQDRWMNVRTYMQTYTSDDGAFGIDAAFGALVDFDYWLKCPAHSARTDQMKVQSLISEMTGGYMLPLINYNPWTDIKREGESLAIVQDAVTNYGFIGVKIYPPMGFYPYGNEANPVIDRQFSRPNLRVLDQKMEALFDWCIANGVPVMAHTSESLGRDDLSDEFGGPTGWDALLQRYSDKGVSPIVNLGHFGGDSPKMDSNGNSTNNEWPRQFAELMAKSKSADHFYGDLAYWTALRACDRRTDDACKAVLNRLQLARNAFAGLDGRLLYGTDWLMSSKEPDWPAYPAEVASALSGVLDLDAFFYLNAIACFGLGKSGAQRARIVNRLGANNLPAWLANA